MTHPLIESWAVKTHDLPGVYFGHSSVHTTSFVVKDTRLYNIGAKKVRLNIETTRGSRKTGQF